METTKTVRIDVFGITSYWNVKGDDEAIRHLGVVMEDAVNGKDLEAAFYLWNFEAQHPTVPCASFERRILMHRRMEEPSAECHYCGDACPAPEAAVDGGDEMPLCGDCAGRERRYHDALAMRAGRVA